MADSFQTMCNDYFARLKAGNKIRTSADTAKARDSNIAQAKTIKKPEVIQDMLKFDSPDIVSNFKLDMAVVKAYESVPKPTGKVSKLEHHFLMYEEGGNYRASKHFVTPENGGSVNYSAC